jgi:ABC-type glycerol-3-phosphate transport system substrate-binding protein
VTLSVFSSTGNLPYPWQISAFEKAYPNIRINLSTVPFGEFYTKTAVLAASSNPPDVFAVDQPTISNLAAGKVILPLNKYLPAGYANSLTAAARADYTYKGQIYSPGPTDTALALFYNKTLLSKIGITPPSTLVNGWTWAQALSAFQKCQKAYSTSSNTVWGLAPTTFGNGTPGFDYIANLFLRSEGSLTAPAGSSALKTFQAISPNGSSVDGYLNSPQAIAGAQFYQNLFQKYKVSPTTGIPNALLDGKACFDMNTSNNILTITQAHVNFQWGVTPWPHFSTPIVHNGSNEIAVGARTKHLAQAVDFVNFISSPAQQEVTFAKTGYLPVISSLYNTIAILKKPPWSIFTQELAHWGQPRPVTPHYLQYSEVVTNALRDIADGASPQSRLNEAAQQLDPLLAQPAGAL